MENIIIIGSGPAGLTAAIYAARANLAPVVVEGLIVGGQLTRTSDIENFPGFPDPIPGAELMERMHAQAERLGVRFLQDEVESVDFFAGPHSGHSLHLGFSGDVLETRALVIATGAMARDLGLPSEKALKGRGVSGCATCDGAFFKGKDVVVIGGGDTALEDALYLSRLCKNVTIVHRRDAFRASKIMADRVQSAANIHVRWNAVVEEILDVAAKKVTAVRLRDTVSGELSDLPVDGVFVAIGHAPSTALFKGKLEMDPAGYLRTEHSKTSVPGVFAAGDVQDPRYRQAISAAGSGCVAALEAERYLATLS